jgi:hypothetical protein
MRNHGAFVFSLALACFAATTALAQEGPPPAQDVAAPAQDSAALPDAGTPASTTATPASATPASTTAVPASEAVPAPGVRVGTREGSAGGPWRLHKAIGAPSWIRFGLEQRARYEHLQDDFHSGATGNSAGSSLRTLLSAELDFAPVVVGAEIEDSRAYTTEATPLNTTIVNPLEVLQAYAGLRHEGLFVSGDSAALTLGRFTIDLGSRRLVARNEFRNTINTYTGVDLRWTCPRKHMLRGFAVMPVLRFPSEDAELADNSVELDRENTDALFWAVFFGSAPLVADVQLETYVFGLHERDGTDAASANRKLFTPGVRVLRAPAKGQLDFQVETIFQFGTSRASTSATDTADLTHRAVAVHATVGRRFDVAWTPRLALQYDFASGDGDPDDERNGRFDPLFAARRFEFGPTGLYGAFGRTNMSSPGLRVEVAPHRTVDAIAAYRLHWLASARDAWAAAKLKDPSGQSGKFIGQQIEARVRWHVYPKNLSFDAGAAYLIKGEFATDAPDGSSASPLFVYTQMTISI